MTRNTTIRFYRKDKKAYQAKKARLRKRRLKKNSTHKSTRKTKRARAFAARARHQHPSFCSYPELQTLTRVILWAF